MIALLQLFVAQAAFTGNQSCKPCHQAVFENYQRTPMARSSGIVADDVPTGKFRHDASNTSYNISRQGSVAGRTLSYFIGSGAAGRSYLYGLDGFLFQAPVTWYSQKNRWDMSPGYEEDHDPLWNRPVTPNCLFCHASQVRPIYGTENRYAEPPIAQNGVSCERCHGPGSEHVLGKARMVNPAKLDPARRDSVCSQCHLAGEARVEKSGKQLAAYRPGDLLADFATYFVTSGDSVGVKATGYVERFAQSRCKQASGDKIWCATCHDPHKVPAAEESIGYFRKKCMSCHQQAHSDTAAVGSNCISCHMPKEQVVDGGHGILTDHAIPRKPRQQATSPSPGWKLESFLGGAGTREAGLAYAEVGLRTGNPRQQDEAIRLLSQSSVDPDVAVRLGDLLQRKGKIVEAERLYLSAIQQRPPGPMVALVNLGVIHGSRGEYQKAIRFWRLALEQNPGQREAAVNLIKVLRALGRVAEASKVEEGMRRFDSR